MSDTRACPNCINGLVRIVRYDGKVVYLTCNRCAGTGRTPKH